MQETPVWFLIRNILWRRDRLPTLVFLGFPGGSDSKESACNMVDLSSIPGLGRSPGEGHGNPLKYSCLENPHRQRSLAGYSPCGSKELDTTEWLNTAQHRPFSLSLTEFVITLLLFQVMVSSRTRDWTCTPCIGRWSLNHWTTSEVPCHYFLNSFFYNCFWSHLNMILQFSVKFLIWEIIHNDVFNWSGVNKVIS